MRELILTTRFRRDLRRAARRGKDERRLRDVLAQIHRRDDYAAAERAIGAREGDGPGTIWGRGGRCLSSVAAGRLCDRLRMSVRAR